MPTLTKRSEKQWVDGNEWMMDVQSWTITKASTLKVILTTSLCHGTAYANNEYL